MAFKMKFSGFKANLEVINQGLGNLASGLSSLEGESDEDKQKRSDKKTARKVKKELKKRGVSKLNPTGY